MKLPGYKLGRVVGAGKVYTTYSALDVQRSKTVVIRVFNEMLSGDKAFQLHFKKVTRYLFNKSLGNNIQLLDAACSSKSCVMVTNYCSGKQLRHGKKTALSKDKVIEIGRQIAIGLSQLHEMDIVHGGIELSNINLLDNGEVILGPVAVHRTMPGNNLTHFALENIEDVVYLAPEARTGLTPGTDFYALGVVLYELLTGEKPFNTDRITDLEQQKYRGDYRPLQESLVDLKPLFDSLLSPDPEFRIMSDKELESVLEVYRIDASASNISTSVDEPENSLAGESMLPAVSGLINFIARNSRVLTVVSGFIICVALVILLLPEKKHSPQQAVELINSSIVTSKPEIVIKAPVVIKQSQEESKEQGFYAVARTLMVTGDYDAALKVVDDAIVTAKNMSAAEELKSEINREIKIQAFISLAEQQFLENKIIMPPGDNAFETYQRIANLSPDGDEKAQPGLEKIADHYLLIAKEQMSKNNLDAAKKAVIQGLMVKSDDAALLELKYRLAGEGQIQHEKIYTPETGHSNIARSRSKNVIFKQFEAAEQSRPAGKYGRIERRIETRSEVASQ